MKQDIEQRVTDYYAALRDGESLSAFFREAPDTVTVGLSERQVGYADVAAELSEQTATTVDWTVESHDLSVSADGDTAWFSDLVTLGWTDSKLDTDYSFETRWTGTLTRRDRSEPWQFVVLHVSVANEELRTAEDDLFAWDG